MCEARRCMTSSVVVWPVWTGSLLLVSAFAISARATGLVSMETFIPSFALVSLAIVGLYDGSGRNGNKLAGTERLSERQADMVGACATLIFLLSLLLWLGLQSGAVLLGDSVACRQASDIVMLLCASISIACWYRSSVGSATVPAYGVKGLYVLKVLVALIVGLWILELAYFLLQGTAMESVDGTRLIMGRILGITAASLSALALKDRLDLQGREARRERFESGAMGIPCAHYDALRSLERVKLSDRELMVLSFTLLGDSARSIGERLGVSTPTVGSYRQRGYRKMGVSSKKELIDLVSKYEGVDVVLEPGAAVVERLRSGAAERASATPMPMGEDSHKTRKKSVAVKISMVMVVLCSAILFLYGIVHYVLQAAFANDFLFYFGDPIKYVAMGVLVISSAVLVACGDQKKSPSLFSSIEANGPSMMGFIVMCVGVFCSAAMVGESFYSISTGGVWGFIGMIAAITCIGLSGEVPDARDVSLIRRALKLARSNFPEVLLLFSASIPLADAASSILLSASIDSYPLITGAYRLGVMVLVVYALARLRSGTCGEELAPSGYEQLRHLLLGHGLTEPQAEVVIMSLQGQSAASICAKLLLAPGTVSSYRARAYAKLGVHGLNGLRKLVEVEMQSSCQKEEDACSDR